MGGNLYKPNIFRFAAALLGFLPVGQTVYFLILDQLGIEHSSYKYALFMSLLLFLPAGTFLVLRRSSFQLQKVDVAVFCLIGLMAANLIFRTIDLAVRDVVLFCCFVVGPYVAARLLPRDLLPSFLLGLFLACAALAFYAFIFAATLVDSLDTVIRPMLLGIDHGVHLVGVALAVLICVVAGSLSSFDPGWKRILLYCLASLCMAMLIIFSSRGMAVAAFTTVLISLAVFPRVDFLPRLVQLLCMAMAVYIALNLSPPTLAFFSRVVPSDSALERLYQEGIYQGCLELSSLLNSSDIRAMLYTKAVEQFFTNPLFGVGLLNYAENYCEGTFPHSTLLQIAAELGLVGLLFASLTLWFLVPRTIAKVRNAEDDEVRGGLILIAILICSLIVDQLYGNLISMASTMTLLGVLVSWLGAPVRHSSLTVSPFWKKQDD